MSVPRAHRRLAHLVWLLLFGCAHSPAATSSENPAAGDTVFTETTVIPMDGDAPRRLVRHDVLVHAGRIAALGPSGQVAIPPGARRIDGRGKYLLPGLADMHVHASDTATLKLFLAYGVTTVRNMWGTPAHLRWRDQVARGTILGPTIYTAGPLVDGPGAVWNGTYAIETAEQADAVVARQKRAGYDFIKVYARLSPPVYDAVVTAARRHGLPVAGHVPAEVGLEHVLAQRQDTIEHLDGMLKLVQTDDSPARDKKGLEAYKATLEHVDPAKVTALAQKIAASGVWSCPTLIVHQRFVPLAQATQWWNAPEMRYVPPILRASWDPARDHRTRSLPEEFWQLRRKEAELKLALVRALHAAGARLLLGTDEANPFVAPGSAVVLELENLVAAGLSPFQALRAATGDAARAMHAEGEFGTIAVGRRADLVLVDSDPLESVSHVARPTGVMARGRYLSAADIHQMLEELAASYVPRPDRFAGRPALAKEGEREFAATYALDLGGMVFGNERVAVDRLKDGRRVLHGQVVTDDPDGLFLTQRVELDAAGAPLAIALHAARPEGTVHAVLTREGAEAHLVAELPIHGRIERRVPLGDGELAILGSDGSQVLAAMASVARLGGEGKKERRRITLRFDPEPDLAALNWAVEPQPEGYTLSVKATNLKETHKVVVDTAGRIRSMRIESTDVTGVTRLDR